MLKNGKLSDTSLNNSRERKLSKKNLTFFQMLIMNQLTEKKINSYLLNSNVSLAETLISEMKKEKYSDKVLSKIKNLLTIQVNNPSQRNISLMMLILKQIDYFKKFVILNKVDDLTLRLVCNNMVYLRIRKGEYVFHKDDVADNFYVIIQGQIAIMRPERKERKIEKDSSQKVKEEEKVVCILQNGEYFGDWGLLESKLRYASAFAFVDTDLFYLTRDKFEHSLSKTFRKTNNEQKTFLKESIPPFVKIGQFDFLFKTMTKCFFNKNEIVYKEGDNADKIYLIYEGEFSVRKNEGHGEGDIGKNLTKTIIHLSKGEFVGLETIKNFDHPDEKDLYKFKYETTLISNKDFNILFCLKTEMIKNFYKKEVKDFFLNLYNSRSNIIKNFYTKSIGLKHKFQITFRENIFKLKINTNASLLQSTQSSLNKLMNMERTKETKPKFIRESFSLTNIKTPTKKIFLSPTPVKPVKKIAFSPLTDRLTLSHNTFKYSNHSKSIYDAQCLSTNIFKTISSYSKEKNTYNTGTLSLPLVTNIIYKK